MKTFIVIAAGMLSLAHVAPAAAQPREYNRGYYDCLAGRYDEEAHSHAYRQGCAPRSANAKPARRTAKAVRCRSPIATRTRRPRHGGAALAHRHEPPRVAAPAGVPMSPACGPRRSWPRWRRTDIATSGPRSRRRDLRHLLQSHDRGIREVANINGRDAVPSELSLPLPVIGWLSAPDIAARRRISGQVTKPVSSSSPMNGGGPAGKLRSTPAKPEQPPAQKIGRKFWKSRM